MPEQSKQFEIPLGPLGDFIRVAFVRDGKSIIRGLRRERIGLAVSTLFALRVDTETQEVVGYLLASFLGSVVLSAPHLTSILRVAELRDLTKQELGGLEAPEAPKPGPEAEVEAAKALANEFTKLIAS